ncbi:sugar O-acetyltransferase [Agaribacter flavus]|uniref:Sugar O-acetyltransferase n=1 Tax=Agaribacter flavus TaxID=1902781 RepID=A0ABV7FSF8_9ALTE
MNKEIEKCLKGELFNTSDPEILDIIHNARAMTREYNSLSSRDSSAKQEILKALLGRVGENVNIDTPFYCDYGKHTFVGNNVIININCTFVDCNTITIGNDVLIASNVQIYTATHPVTAQERLVDNWQQGDSHPYFRTFAQAVLIADKVWIGGGVIILPGVHIGEGAVIGAGSVVTKDIPAYSVAYGNPARVVRQLTP